jgi:hypothetical protein
VQGDASLVPFLYPDPLHRSTLLPLATGHARSGISSEVPMISRRASGWTLVLALLTSAVAAGADFLGSESCKGCHPDAYAAWRGSKHARSMESLTAEQQREPRCTTCHAPNLTDQSMAGIGCETCHGGGQYYAPAYVMKDPELARLVGLVDPSEKSCRSCHEPSSPSLRPFEFAEKLKAMDHWSAEKQRRGAPPSPRADR